MGWTTSPYPRACALSCPSPALYGGRPFPDSPWPLYCYHPHGPDAPSLRRVASPSLFVPSPRKFPKLVHLGDAPPCFEHKLQVLHMQGRGHSSSRPTHQARSNEMVRSAVPTFRRLASRVEIFYEAWTSKIRHRSKSETSITLASWPASSMRSVWLRRSTGNWAPIPANT